MDAQTEQCIQMSNRHRWVAMYGADSGVGARVSSVCCIHAGGGVSNSSWQQKKDNIDPGDDGIGRVSSVETN